VIRGTRIGSAALVHCAVVLTIADLARPPHDLTARAKRTAAYLTLYATNVVALHLLGAPPPIAALAAVPTMLLALTAGGVIVIRRSHDAWHVRAGRDAALLLLRHDRRRDRWELHSWVAWRQRRGLGGAVALAALTDTPRPLWLRPATPDLRGLYHAHGAHDDPHTPWLVID
jgi:hypothetical protein